MAEVEVIIIMNIIIIMVIITKYFILVFLHFFSIEEVQIYQFPKQSCIFWLYFPRWSHCLSLLVMVIISLHHFRRWIFSSLFPAQQQVEEEEDSLDVSILPDPLDNRNSFVQSPYWRDPVFKCYFIFDFYCQSSLSLDQYYLLESSILHQWLWLHHYLFSNKLILL